MYSRSDSALKSRRAMIFSPRSSRRRPHGVEEWSRAIDGGNCSIVIGSVPKTESLSARFFSSPDVARPAVPLQRIHCVVIDGQGRALVMVREPPQKRREQKRDVGRPLAQSRHIDRDTGQAEIEILTEFAGARHRLQVAVTRRDHLHIDSSVAPWFLRHGAPAHPRALAAIVTAAQRSMSPISSRKRVPPPASSKRPLWRLCIRERAAGHDQQLRLDQVRPGIAAQLSLMNGCERRRLSR